MPTWNLFCYYDYFRFLGILPQDRMALFPSTLLFSNVRSHTTVLQ
uniref:Uncharacterized protein n=1 Tax=Arundo donax TaxID=35708 RepID=A0A0A8ZKJ9_ARUDO